MFVDVIELEPSDTDHVAVSATVSEVVVSMVDVPMLAIPMIELPMIA